ncbi:MAG TPA: MlaD family protein [Acidobacteriaceae bacterium]|nr:MlaD family protein [Acidobacteriaceae bacterium]
MPGQQEVRWSQLKVGVLVIVALCALVALIFLMSGSSGGFWTGKLTLHSYFENSAGLKNGAPVNLDGVTVGNVSHVQIDLNHGQTPVEVIMKVNKNGALDIREDSKSSLTTIGVLGDTVVDINSRGAHGPPIRNGEELQTNETPDLQDVIQASQGTIEQLDTILTKVNQVVDSLNSNKGSIGMLINDPTLYKRAVTTVNELSSIVDQVNNGQGSIGKLLKDDTMYDRLNDMVTKADAITTELNEGKGTAGKLLKDDALYNQLKDSSQNLNKILADINAGKGTLGVLAKDPQTAAKLSDTIVRLDSVLTKLDNGEGTMGALLKDRALYNHVDEVTRNTNELMLAIRKDPKKYLNIRVHIF